MFQGYSPKSPPHPSALDRADHDALDKVPLQKRIDRHDRNDTRDHGRHRDGADVDRLARGRLTDHGGVHALCKARLIDDREQHRGHRLQVRVRHIDVCRIPIVPLIHAEVICALSLSQNTFLIRTICLVFF